MGDTAPVATCAHDPCWRGLVRDPLDGSACCLACCAHVLRHWSHRWSAPRAAAAARALASALRDLPRPLPGPLRTAAAPPVWALTASALHAFMNRTPDPEARNAAGQGVCEAVTLLCLSNSRDASDLVRSAIEDVVDAVCSSTGASEQSEAELSLLAALARVDRVAVASALAARTGDVYAALVRLLPSQSTLLPLVRLLGRLSEDGRALQRRLLPAVLRQSAAALCSPVDDQRTHAELLQCLCQLLASCLGSLGGGEEQACCQPASELVCALKPLLLQARLGPLRAVAVRCLAALVRTWAAPLCARLHMPDVLVECLVSPDALFLETVVDCLCLFTQCPAFFENLIAAYAFQPLLTCASQLAAAKRMESAADCLRLLRVVLSRQQGFRASRDLVQSAVRHLSTQLNTGHLDIVLVVLGISAELCSGSVLPVPVPLSLLEPHIDRCLQAVASGLVSPGSGSGGGRELATVSARPVVPALLESQEQASLDSRLLRSGIRLLLRWVQVHSHARQDPAANEDSYVQEGGQRGRQDTLSFVLKQLVELFLPHCQRTQWGPACEAFLECLCLCFRLAEGSPSTLREQLLRGCPRLLSFLWDTRAHQRELAPLTGAALAWTLWFATEDHFRDTALLASLQIGCQSLPDSFEECLPLLQLSHRAHAEAHLAVLALCCLHWRHLTVDGHQDSFAVEWVEPPLSIASAVTDYALTSGAAGCQSPLVLSLLCRLIPSLVSYSGGPQEKLEATSYWLLDCLRNRCRWEDVLCPQRDVLLWCVSTIRHQEVLGSFAFCKWMDQPEPPQDLEVFLSRSLPALNALLRLLTTSEESVAQKTASFVKMLIQRSPSNKLVSRDCAVACCACPCKPSLTGGLHRTAAGEGAGGEGPLWRLLELVVQCREGSRPGLLVDGELQLFQQVMQLSLEKSGASHESTVLAYLSTVLRGAETDVDSAASLLLSSAPWLAWLESQLSAGTPHSWSLLSALAQVQRRAQLVGERSVLVEKRALLRELGCKDPGRALVTLLLLPILFQGAGVARVSLRYADCSGLAYALATHMAKRDTHLQMAALDALESLFPFARLLAHDEGCQCCLPAHPWLTRVLVLGSLNDKDCIRLLDLVSVLLTCFPADWRPHFVQQLYAANVPDH
ncbi:uncharacterized protein LOC144146138 [Haemaphysalis longicornis]